MIRASTLDAIGHTPPLIKLQGPSRQTGCTILGKAEMMNPAGSVKDRAAKAIVEGAEARGAIRPGATLVEGTAGNTGIALAMVAKAHGYGCTIVIPETQSQEKKDAIQLYGAKLVQVPAAPFKDLNNYVHVSRRLAEEMNAADPGLALWETRIKQANRLPVAASTPASNPNEVK